MQIPLTLQRRSEGFKEQKLKRVATCQKNDIPREKKTRKKKEQKGKQREENRKGMKIKKLI